MRGTRAVVVALVLAVAMPQAASARGVQIVRSDRAFAQWSAGVGCVGWFVHVLAERSRVVDPPDAPGGAALAWVSIVKADGCTGTVIESSSGRVLTRGLRIGPSGASLRATVPLVDGVSGEASTVRVEVEWTVTGAEEVRTVEHDRGVVRLEATWNDAAATGRVTRSTGSPASGEADTAGILTFRRLAAGADAG